MTGGQTEQELSCTLIQSWCSYTDFNGNFFEWCSQWLKPLRVRVSLSSIHSELGRGVVTAPFLLCLILHFMYFSALRLIVNFSDVWKSHEEFRLFIQQSFESVTWLSFHRWLFQCLICLWVSLWLLCELLVNALVRTDQRAFSSVWYVHTVLQVILFRAFLK